MVNSLSPFYWALWAFILSPPCSYLLSCPTELSPRMPIWSMPVSCTVSKLQGARCHPASTDTPAHRWHSVECPRSGGKEEEQGIPSVERMFPPNQTTNSTSEWNGVSTTAAHSPSSTAHLTTAAVALTWLFLPWGPCLPHLAMLSLHL